MSKKVAIIIVNWNGKRFLKDCFESLQNQTYKNFDIYFVDNGSVDESIDYVRTEFPQITIISLEKNYWYAKWNNEGIKKAFQDKEVEYIVCLNNDTIVEKYWLEELVQTAQKDTKIWAVSSKAYFIWWEVIQNAGLIYDKALQINKLGWISLGYGLQDSECPELSKDTEIFCPGWVAPLYKRNVLEEIYSKDQEIFDEDFFAYSEDLDLGFRIKNLWYTSYLSANAKLIHLHSQTWWKSSPFKAYYCERNTYLTAIKNLGWWDLLLFPFRNVVLKLSYFKNKNESVEKLKSNNWIYTMIWILIKAHVSVLILLPKFLHKRWKIKNKKVIY